MFTAQQYRDNPVEYPALLGSGHSSGKASELGERVITDARLLANASDLTLPGDDSERLVLSGYFSFEKPIELTSPAGEILSARLLKNAAIAAGRGECPVGRVENISGSGAVIRNGVTVELNIGDLIYKDDVIQTGLDSVLGISFIDGSAFILSGETRMIVREFIYDPAGSTNFAIIHLEQGLL